MSESVARCFTAEGVSYRYPRSRRWALDSVDLAFETGVFSGVIGPNGAGKSTLVRLFGGTVAPTEGRVRILGEDAEAWDRSALARQLAVVSQDAPPDSLPMSVRAYVELGRNPYVSPWAPLGPKDRETIERALEWADLEQIQGRALTALSGGERQRAKLARALAQEPEILLLDEPTAHLDVGHALWVFEALSSLVLDRGLTVVCITHDIHLASRYAEHLALISTGRLVMADIPDRVLTPQNLAAAYECEVRVEALGELGHVVLPLTGRTASRGGSR